MPSSGRAAARGTPSTERTTLGSMIRPVASRAVITASCKGEVSTKPCPIEAFSVSPTTQSSPRLRRFHCIVGARPCAMPDIGRSWRTPHPSRTAMAEIASIPTRWARS
jgi:hypothetical protein